MKKQAGLTLTEVIIVVIIVGILSSFGILMYHKAIQKAQERIAIANLTAIHAAAEIYYSNERNYYPGTLMSAEEINEVFDLNIINDGLDYRYKGIDDSSFVAVANLQDKFKMCTDARNIPEDNFGDPNPCCQIVGKSCLVVDHCSTLRTEEENCTGSTINFP